MPCVTINVVSPAVNFELRNFRVTSNGRVLGGEGSTIEVVAGQEICVLAELWNVSSVRGSAKVFLKVNGRTEREATVSVDPNAYVPVGWCLKLSKGTYDICLEYTPL